MERILVILNRVETAQSVLNTASYLKAALGNSRLDLLHPRPDMDPSFMPTEEVLTDERSHAFEALRDTLFQDLTDVFNGWQSQEATSSDLTLRQVVGKVEEIVSTEAARADLVVLGSAGSAHDLEAKHEIEIALFDAAAPVLLVPEAPAECLGRRIAVAWESSHAADEAISAALPLLKAAELVIILLANEGHSRAALPAGLLQALEQNGTAIQIQRFDLNGRDIGPALLDEAQAAQADLFVMGAFTHNRTMEALFGGATRQILADANLPVLMHH